MSIHPPTVYFVGKPSEVAHHAAPLGLRLKVSIIDPDEVIQLARPGDLAIFYSEHFDRFRNACRSLQQKQVGTLYLIDGILEWRNAWENRPDEPACPYTMRPVLSHKAACIGMSQARILEDWGNAGKVEVVGIPRLDQVSLQPKRTSRTGGFKILVLTAKTPGFTERQVARVRQSLLDLKNWFGQSAESTFGHGCELIWRLTGGLDRELGVENQLDDFTGSDLVNALADVDAVISTPSTAMLEAMLMDLPVASLDYHNCPSYLQAAWTIRSPETIAEVMEELGNPPEKKMLFQRSQLRDALYHIGEDGESSTDRLERLVREMLKSSAEQLAAGQPLRFAPRILDRPTGCSEPDFDHRRIYPNVREFGENDIRELQVELSHARREISHLQREKAQLQSELDQAHEIFEQIQRHPVAGPIVRVRQRLIDWLTGFKVRRNESASSNPNFQNVCPAIAPDLPVTAAHDDAHPVVESQVTTS